MKKCKRIGAFFLSLTLAAGMLGTAYHVQAQVSWSETKIEDEYALLSEFSVPKRQLTVEGQQVDAEAVVTMPDGTSTKAETVKLKTAGLYKVTYTAEVDGKAYVEEETFYVYNNLCGFTSEDSSAVWGKYEHSEATEGLMVRLAEGDTLTLNEPIDMNELESDDLLIQAFATPDSVGHEDFNKLCFQFTDVEDPSVTLYISAKQTSEDPTLPYTYCVAGGNGQTPKGLEVGSGKIFEEGYFGQVTWHSFGLGHEFCAEYCDSQALEFRIDWATMSVYSKEGIVADLDSAEFFDTVWEGFPSGKAYLTIWADLYSAKTANFCLVKAGNLNLTQGKVEDTEGPVITIDTEYEEMPTAVKGGCYQYIPTATAKDAVTGECEVTTKVYFNYQQPGHTALDVVDGTFKTDKFGYYAICYEATDGFGNLTQEILWIKAEQSLETPTIALKEKPAASWIQGEKFVPAEYTYTCYSGEPIVNVYAAKGEEIYDLNDGFRFEEEGTYHIVYELKDCAGQTATQEYDIDVKTGDKPVLGKDIISPEYMIEESEYIFPEVVFNDYRNGKKESKIATGKIIDAAGTTEVQAGDTYKVSVDKNGDAVTIAYVCDNASYEVKIPVIKSWGQDQNGRATMFLENYFVGSGTAFSQEEEIVFKATAADGKWTFANPLLAENFVMEIQGVEGAVGYESLVIEMRDSENQNEVLKFELPYTSENLSVCVDGKDQTLKKGVDLSNAGAIAIECKDGALYVAGTKIKNVTVPDFSSDSIYLSMGFVNAGESAAFKLLSLNGHTFGSAKSDKIAPKIVIRGVYGGSYSYQDEITLPSTVAGDTLNPNITFTMTVNMGEEIVKDVNGVELRDVDPTKEYTIKADKYGKYNIAYTAYDSFSEKDSTMSYLIHITDDVAPTIRFQQEPQTEAKVSDVLYIPAYTVKDNESAVEAITVKKYVEDPNSRMILLPENSNSVNASQAGNYKFMVLAIDENGNVCNESWTITVTAEE